MSSCAQVHRFGESVAVYVPYDQGCAYISPTEARKLAAALYAAARSVEREAFVDSACTTTVRFDGVSRFRDFPKPKTQAPPRR